MEESTRTPGGFDSARGWLGCPGAATVWQSPGALRLRPRRAVSSPEESVLVKWKPGNFSFLGVKGLWEGLVEPVRSRSEWQPDKWHGRQRRLVPQ